jgi:hypothetical protein
MEGDVSNGCGNQVIVLPGEDKTKVRKKSNNTGGPLIRDEGEK